MKKFFILSLCVLAANITTHAQSFRYGVTAGLGIDRSGGTIESTGLHLGYRAGVEGLYEFKETPRTFYLKSGLLLAGKGYKTPSSGYYGGPFYHSTINQNYIELPLMAGYKHSHFFWEAGPYMAYALGGNRTTKGNGEKVSSSVHYGENGFKRFDFGIGFNFGVEFAKHYRVAVGYEHGLMQLYNDPDKGNPTFIDLTYKNRTATLTMSYIF